MSDRLTNHCRELIGMVKAEGNTPKNEAIINALGALLNEIAVLRKALHWVADTNAMDYEYRNKALKALASSEYPVTKINKEEK